MTTKTSPFILFFIFFLLFSFFFSFSFLFPFFLFPFSSGPPTGLPSLCFWLLLSASKLLFDPTESKMFASAQMMELWSRVGIATCSSWAVGRSTLRLGQQLMGLEWGLVVFCAKGWSGVLASLTDRCDQC